MSFPPSGPPYPGDPNQPPQPYGQPAQPYGQPGGPGPGGYDPYGQSNQPGPYGQQQAPYGQPGGPGTPPPFPGAPVPGGNPFDAPPGGFPPPPGRPPKKGIGARLLGCAGVVGVLIVFGVVKVLIGSGVDEVDDALNGPDRAGPSAEITEGGTLDPWDLKVGDCFLDDQTTNTSADGQTVYSIDALPCTDPHNAQVLTTLTLTGAFPGGQAVVDKCGTKLQTWFDGHPAAVKKLEKKDPGFQVLAYYPDGAAWNTGGSRVTCSVYTHTNITFKVP
ncbi:hypothetical protein GCM10022221_71400 [Actinocorallia aurea]